MFSFTVFASQIKTGASDFSKIRAKLSDTVKENAPDIMKKVLKNIDFTLKITSDFPLIDDDVRFHCMNKP